MDQVYQHIFIGDWESAHDFKELTRNQIATIVMVSERTKSSDVLEKYSQLNIRHVHIECFDACLEDLLPKFHSLCDMKLVEPILFHCTAGMSRSPTFALAYLKTKGLKSLDDAMTLVSQQRDISPNQGFLDQLGLWYENKNIPIHNSDIE